MRPSPIPIAAFVINTGDLVSGLAQGMWGQQEKEWRAYHEIISEDPNFTSRYFDLPGNHDRYGDKNWKWYGQ
ncbi:MAG: hypothetical protein DRG63_06705 [Deltaproteobacteria bacterium]|nr:MAG: hypothetical protein DRG63_06705 [Deltaproteobacteria bacterium]